MDRLGQRSRIAPSRTVVGDQSGAGGGRDGGCLDAVDGGGHGSGHGVHLNMTRPGLAISLEEFDWARAGALERISWRKLLPHVSGLGAIRLLDAFLALPHSPIARPGRGGEEERGAGVRTMLDAGRGRRPGGSAKSERVGTAAKSKFGVFWCAPFSDMGHPCPARRLRRSRLPVNGGQQRERTCGHEMLCRDSQQCARWRGRRSPAVADLAMAGE